MVNTIEETLPSIQHNSFIVPLDDPYEFVDRKERQAYENYHYEFSYNRDGSYVMQKHASRALSYQK